MLRITPTAPTPRALAPTATQREGVGYSVNSVTALYAGLNDAEKKILEPLLKALFTNKDGKTFSVCRFVDSLPSTSRKNCPAIIVQLIKIKEEQTKPTEVFFSERLPATDSKKNRFAAILGVFQRLEKLTSPFLPDNFNDLPTS
jgi:hypothetical protein